MLQIFSLASLGASFALTAQEAVPASQAQPLAVPTAQAQPLAVPASQVQPLEVPATQAQPLQSLPAATVDVSSRFNSLPKPPQHSDDGYWIDNAPINEVFQYLAHSAGLRRGSQFLVTLPFVRNPDARQDD